MKEELVDFCRKNGLPTSGGKVEITDSIAHFLDTGEIMSASRERKTTVQIGDIDLNTKIEPNFVCTEKHRAFFKEHIGNTFSFNVAFQKWLKSNTGKTYEEAIEAYYQILEEKKKYNAWKIGTVMSVGLFKRKDVPYPVNKTKEIIRAAGVNADRKVERYNRKLFKKLKKEQEKSVKEIAEKNRKRIARDWIDCIEEYDALFND